MRAEFTQHFFSPQQTDTLTTTTANVSAPGVIRYDEQRYGAVDAFMRHADFVPFKQQYIRLIDQVIAFAHARADQLTPPVTKPRMQAISSDFETFKHHLFDAEQDFFSSHKYLLYGVGFDAIKQLSHLLKDERIALQRRMDTVLNLAPDTTVCAGGCITGLQKALSMLTTSERGIIASAHRFKQQMVENAALNHSRRHHQYDPGNEVHYANAYLNFSADTLGIAPRLDPFARTAESEMTLELLNEFAQATRHSLRPITMVEAMADDYASRIRQVAQTDAAGTISLEQIAATQQRIEALQTSILDAEYGPIPMHDVLIELPAGGNYQIIKPPTLVAVRLMDRLKKEKIINFEPIVLAKAVDGGANLLYLDGLIWLKRNAQHEALDLTTLCQTLPLDMLATLSRNDAPDKEKYLAIFCHVAEAVATLHQAESPGALPDGWLKNFVTVLGVTSGASRDELALRLLNLSLRLDDGNAFTALIDVGLDKKAITSAGYSLAGTAVARGCTNVLRALLQAGVDVELGAAVGTSALMVAARSNNIIAVKSLLEAGAQIDAASAEGKTALMIAARRGDAPMVDVLLNAGASVDAAMQTGEGALLLAAKSGRVGVVQRIIDAGAQLDARGTGKLTALMVAAQGGHTGALEALLQAGAPIESRTDFDQHTALTLAALNGHLDAVNVLLAADAQVSSQLVSGHNALMLAAISGNNAIVAALLAAGADTGCRTVEEGRPALMLAAGHGHAATVTLLVNAGADIDSRSLLGNTALMQAVMAGQHAALTVLLAAGAPIESRATFGDYTALMHAAIYGDAESLRLLLEADACVDTMTRTGQTALSLAANEDNTAAVEILVSRGASTECRTVTGFTPLMIMAQRGRITAVAALLTAGASMEALAPDGRTARDILQQVFVGEVRDMLLNTAAMRDA